MLLFLVMKLLNFFNSNLSFLIRLYEAIFFKLTILHLFRVSFHHQMYETREFVFYTGQPMLRKMTFLLRRFRPCCNSPRHFYHSMLAVNYGALATPCLLTFLAFHSVSYSVFAGTRWLARLPCLDRRDGRSAQACGAGAPHPARRASAVRIHRERACFHYNSIR